jgi:hypothetical protein
LPRLSPRRALVATALVCAGLLAGTLVGGVALAGGPFSDVGPTHPFRSQIGWLTQHEITTGYPDGTFRGGEPVTRQAMAAFLARSTANLRVDTGTLNPTIASTVHFVSAECDADERAVAGGGSVDNGGLFLNFSRPSANGRVWEVSYRSVGGELIKPGRVDAWALCVPGGIE